MLLFWTAYTLAIGGLGVWLGMRWSERQVRRIQTQLDLERQRRWP
jgi:uncharacterized membrane protein